MNKLSFQHLLQEFSEAEADLLDMKRGEYAEPEGDVLQNFYVIADLTGLTPAQVAGNYLAKHVQSILKQVYSEDLTWAWTDGGHGEGLKQRIADARNYLLLLAACIQDGQSVDMQERVDSYLEHDSVASEFSQMSNVDRLKMLEGSVKPGENFAEAVARTMRERREEES